MRKSTRILKQRQAPEQLAAQIAGLQALVTKLDIERDRVRSEVNCMMRKLEVGMGYTPAEAWAWTHRLNGDVRPSEAEYLEAREREVSREYEAAVKNLAAVAGGRPVAIHRVDVAASPEEIAGQRAMVRGVLPVRRPAGFSHTGHPDAAMKPPLGACSAWPKSAEPCWFCQGAGYAMTALGKRRLAADCFWCEAGHRHTFGLHSQPKFIAGYCRNWPVPEPELRYEIKNRVTPLRETVMPFGKFEGLTFGEIFDLEKDDVIWEVNAPVARHAKEGAILSRLEFDYLMDWCEFHETRRSPAPWPKIVAVVESDYDGVKYLDWLIGDPVVGNGQIVLYGEFKERLIRFLKQPAVEKKLAEALSPRQESGPVVMGWSARRGRNAPMPVGKYNIGLRPQKFDPITNGLNHRHDPLTLEAIPGHAWADHGRPVWLEPQDLSWGRWFKPEDEDQTPWNLIGFALEDDNLQMEDDEWVEDSSVADETPFNWVPRRQPDLTEWVVWKEAMQLVEELDRVAGPTADDVEVVVDRPQPERDVKVQWGPGAEWAETNGGLTLYVRGGDALPLGKRTISAGARAAEQLAELRKRGEARFCWSNRRGRHWLKVVPESLRAEISRAIREAEARVERLRDVASREVAFELIEESLADRQREWDGRMWADVGRIKAWGTSPYRRGEQMLVVEDGWYNAERLVDLFSIEPTLGIAYLHDRDLDVSPELEARLTEAVRRHETEADEADAIVMRGRRALELEAVVAG